MLYRRFLSVLLALAVALFVGVVGGCGGKDEDSAVLATVGDRVVDAEYYKSVLAKLEAEQLPRNEDGVVDGLTTLDGKRRFLDIIIDKELMVAKAVQLGYDQDAQIDVGLKTLIEHHAMMFFWQDEIGDPSRFVTDEDVDDYYSRLGERRDCRYIITDVEADARQAIAEFHDGRPWSEIVARFHDGVEKMDRVPEIRVPWGQYRDDFEEPIFSVAKGEVTEPIPTEHGWWVLLVDDVVQEDKPTLESIKDRVLLSIAKRHENLRRGELIGRVLEERNFALDEEALKVIYAGLPEGESIIDPETQQPTAKESLKPLEVPTATYSDVVMSYDLSSGKVSVTVADLKAQFDRQNVFDRPKKGELLGGLRTKFRNVSEKAIMVDEARKRGYFEDPRAIRASYRQIEEMLVDKVHEELIRYEEYVSPEAVEDFWNDHEAEYERPERRTGQMVLCADVETAQRAREAIASGDATWKAVNNRYGSSPELVQSFGRFTLIPEGQGGPLHDALFDLDMEELSEPFAMDEGWAVVQLTRIIPAEDPTLEEMRDAVAQRIRNRRMDEALRASLAKWTEEFGVTINEELLATMPSWEEAKQEANDATFAAATKKG